MKSDELPAEIGSTFVFILGYSPFGSKFASKQLD